MYTLPLPGNQKLMMHKAEKKYEEQAKQRQIRAILNKLTPTNFEKLFEQGKAVNINNAATLTGVVSQIFDRALMEPTYCEMYVTFSCHLAIELPDFNEDNQKITFKRVLLNKCQEEFERGEREQEEEANKADEEGQIKQSAEEREEKRVKARRRRLGNIRVIGELYKKKMLTERIMHACLQKLLGQYQDPDEEDLEALCKLMSTIGEMIDHQKAKEHMDAYFDKMKTLSNNMYLSSRVRFMLKDAIDLRMNKWQQRRKVEGPKKIVEVHRDAAQEQQALVSGLGHASSISQPARSYDRSLATSSPARGQGTAFPQNILSEKVLPEERLRHMSMAAIKEFYSARDEKEVELCIKDLNSPSFHPLMVSLWVTDSFERKDMERDVLAMLLVNLTKSQDGVLSQAQLIKGFESVLTTLEDAVNDAPRAPEFLGRIFAKVVTENVIPLSEIGMLIREGGEESGRLRDLGLAGDVLGSILEMIKSEKGDYVLSEILTSSNLRLEDFRPLDRFAAPAAYDQLSPQERNVTLGNRDLKNPDQSYDRSLATSSPARGQGTAFPLNITSEKVLPEERLRAMSMAAIKEFYSARDEKEVELCIKDLNSPSFHPLMVSLWVIDSFERKDMERDILAKLLVNLTKSQDGVLSQAQLIKGFEYVLTMLEDAVNDARRAPEFLGRIFAKVVTENVIPLSEIGMLIREGGEESGRLRDLGLAGDVLGSILEMIKSEKGDSVLSEVLTGSNLRLEDFRPLDPNRSRGSTVLSSPNAHIGGYRGLPTQVRGHGAQDVRTEERLSYESRTLSGPLPQRSIGDDSMALGPQGGLGRGMSIRRPPAMSSAPVADIPSLAADFRRTAAGLNGYGTVSERTTHGAREDLIPRYILDRFAAPAAYEQLSPQERNVTLGNRDLKNPDRSYDRSLATSLPAQGQGTAFPLNIPSEKVLPEERLQAMSMSAIKEFYSARDEKEVELCIKDLNSPSFHPLMVSLWVTDSFERKDMERDVFAKLLVNLTKSQDGVLSQAQLIKGFESVLTTLEDAVNDAPRAPEFLGRIFAKVVTENVIPLREIGMLIREGGEEAGRLRDLGLAGDVLGSILEMIKSEKGDSVLSEIRTSSNLRLEDFRPLDPNRSRKLEKFI